MFDRFFSYLTRHETKDFWTINTIGYQTVNKYGLVYSINFGKYCLIRALLGHNKYMNKHFEKKKFSTVIFNAKEITKWNNFGIFLWHTHDNQIAAVSVKTLLLVKLVRMLHLLHYQLKKKWNTVNAA